MKKKLFAMAVVLICVSILASTTLAYFTDIGTARNVITSGGIAIEVVEQQMADGSLKPYPQEPILVMPGVSVSKIVAAKSLQEPAWIRMCYTVTVFDADGEPMEIPAQELEKLILIAQDTDNWTLKDGWWYYSAAVSAGQSTAPLFEQVEFATNIGNGYQNCTVEINVTAQAVQKANNGTTVLDAAGWPEA